MLQEIYAGLVHVNLVTQILVFPCQTCSAYALKKFRYPPKLLRGIYRSGLTWKDQIQGRKVKVKYMDKPCNAC